MHFYKANEVEEMRFYRVPKVLFSNEKYRSLSLNAKMAYGILQDRFELSISNNWIDEEGYIYFIFTVAELCEILQVSNKTAIKIKKQLVKYDLLFDKRIGLKKANRLYISKPELNPVDTYIKYKNNSKNSEPIENTLKCTNYTSENVQSTLLEMYNLHTNDTDLNDTDFNDTDLYQSPPENTSTSKTDGQTDSTKTEIEQYKQIIKQSELEHIPSKGDQKALEQALRLLYFNKKNLKSNNSYIPYQLVREDLQQINKLTLDHALNKFEKASRENTIKNTIAYLAMCIFDSIYSMTLDIDSELRSKGII
ncbi:replication initiator protein A [Lutibacter sp. B2]|nr:replication initiator protein A [Lutibacter sp. B2]